MSYTETIIWGLIWWLAGSIVSFFISLYFHQKLLNNINLFCIVDSDVYHVDYIIHISKITIINKGLQICRDDFASLQPLSISTDGCFFNLIDKSDFFSSNTNNLLLANYKSNDLEQCNQIELVYDFIEKNEQINCTVYHTGNINVIGRPKKGRIIVKRKKTGIQHIYSPNIFTLHFFKYLNIIFAILLIGVLLIIIWSKIIYKAV